MGYKKDFIPPPSTRQLRRKESTPDSLSNLLNFEDNPDLIDPDYQIRIVKSNSKHFTKLRFDFKYDTGTAVVPPTDLKEEGVPPRQAKGRRGLRDSTINQHNQIEDAIPNEVYAVYHRKMEKEEKRMANRDKEKIYFEADKLKTDMESLNSLEWPRCLPHVTYIRDVKDWAEMERKKDLTIKYIETVLGKFDSYKRREDRITKRGKLLTSQAYKMQGKGHLTEKDLQIYSKIDRYEYMGESDTDAEEEVMTNEEIIKHREQKIFAKFGPRIKLNLVNGKTIVAEPFKATKVVNTES